MSVLGQSLNLLSSILAILLTCRNSDTLLCYSNDPFFTVYDTGEAIGCTTGSVAVSTDLIVLPPSLISIFISIQVALLSSHPTL